MLPTAAAVVSLTLGSGGHYLFIYFYQDFRNRNDLGVFGIRGASLSRAAPAVRERRDVAAPSGTHGRSRRAASASPARVACQDEPLHTPFN